MPSACCGSTMPHRRSRHSGRLTRFRWWHAENPTPQFAGKRADHDTLPDDIKELYEKNGEIYFKLKQTFETLKQMHDAQPCDRYEYLKVLSEQDKQYRENWAKYDSYDPNTAKAAKPKRSISKKKSSNAPTS